jgi:phosphoglycolate phosphatase-like HAD superfamily hydrolase
VREFSTIFWDFDGVIKDSVGVKAQAFVQLFSPFGNELVARVRQHHEAHGGMSRFEKFPLYLQWAGELVTTENVDAYCQHFSQIALQAVIDSAWVPGVEAILRSEFREQEFILVTATPQDEIEKILGALNLRDCFSAVFGAPLSKIEAIRVCLAARQIEAAQCLMIGDAKADLDAALANNVPFLLRRHSSNGQVFENYTGESVEDFLKI